MRAVGIVALILSCTACTTEPEPVTAVEESALTMCKDPRPEICTKEYMPVCGSRDTGMRCVTEPCDGAAEWKTYGNKCTACADPKVIGYKPGVCE